MRPLRRLVVILAVLVGLVVPLTACESDSDKTKTPTGPATREQLREAGCC
jgi:hypothetical protein